MSVEDEWSQELAPSEPRQLVDGVRLVISGPGVGFLTGGWLDDLTALGLAHRACAGGGASSDGEVVMSTPELGVYSAYCSSFDLGKPVVAATALD